MLRGIVLGSLLVKLSMQKKQLAPVADPAEVVLSREFATSEKLKKLS